MLELLDYGTLRVIWWGLLGVLVAGFVIADGFDLGVAILLPFVGKNDAEKRVMINSVGPVWEGNQVWLLLGAGSVFAAFPLVYSALFSCFYFAMYLALFSLVLRPCGFVFRSKMPSETWRRNWDMVLTVGGVVTIVVLGVGLGNVMQGVRFWFDETLAVRNEGSFFALFNPFALLVGLLALAVAVMHGAVYLNNKTVGEIQDRSRKIVAYAAGVVIVLFIGVFASLFKINGYEITSEINVSGPSDPLLKTVVQQTGLWATNYLNNMPLFVLPLLVIGGASLVIWSNARSKDKLSFVASGICAAAIVFSLASAMFPFLFPSSFDMAASLTIWDASSSHLTLMLMLGVTLVVFPMVLAYTAFVFRVLRGKVTVEDIEKDSKTLY